MTQSRNNHPPRATEPVSGSVPRGRFLDQLAVGCAVAVLLLGLAVIASWIFKIEALKSVMPGLATMKFNTALGFALAGAALLWREKRLLSLALGALVALLGVLTLAEYVSGRDFGIDQLFFRHAAEAGKATINPGRMAPATALCFSLCGTALMLLGTRRAGGRMMAEILAIAAGATGAVALLGYLLGEQHLYTMPGFISMALHTAAGFALLAAGLLCAVPQGVLSLAVISRGTGLALWVGFGVLTALLLALGVFSAGRLSAISADIRESSEIVQKRVVATKEMEIHSMGYCLKVRAALSGSSAAPAEADAQKVARHLAEYERLVRTPLQGELAARFSAKWRELHTHGQSLLTANTATPAELERLASLSRSLERILDHEMQPDMQAALDASNTATVGDLQTTEGFTLLLLVGGIIVALVTSAAVARMVLGGEAALRASEEKLRAQFTELSHIYEHAPVGLCVLDRELHFVRINERLASINGFPAEKHIGRQIHEIVPTLVASMEEIVASILASGRAIENHEFSGETAAQPGTKRYWNESWYPLHDAEGTITGFGVVVEEITERKLFEIELAASRQRFVGIVESAMDAIISVGADQRIVLFNAAAEKMFRCPAAEVIGATLDRFIPERFRTAHMGHVRVFGDSGSTSRGMGHLGAPLIGLRADGEEFPFEASISKTEAGGEYLFTVILRDITKRLRAEAALRESEEKYRALVTVSKPVLFRVNADWTELLEMSTDGFLAAPQRRRDWFSDYIHAEDLAAVQDAIQEAIRSKSQLEIEHRVRRADGSDGWTHSRGVPLLDAAGEIREWFGAATDITDRKQAEEQLHESREDLDRAQHVGQLGSWRLDVRQDVLTWSDENHRIFGIPKGTLLTYKMFLQSVHPDDRAYVDERWSAAMKGEPYDIEHRIIVDGQMKWVREKAYLEFDDAGGLAGGFGITQDITARKHSDEALRESEERFRKIFQGAATGIVLADMEGRFEQCNPAYCALLGYSEDELLQTSFLSIVHPDDGEANMAENHRLLAGEIDHYEIANRYIHRDGRSIWVRKHVSMLSELAGKRAHIMVLVTDMSSEAKLHELNATLEQQVAERTWALSEREQRLRAILDTVVDAVVTVDEHGTIIGINPATKRMFGYDESELLDQNVSMLMTSPHNQNDWHLEIQPYSGMENIAGTGRDAHARRKDGSVFPINLAVSKVNELGLFTGVIRDITYRKRLEADVLHISEDERHRVAAELHDGVCQELAAIGLSLYGVVNELSPTHPPLTAKLKDISKGIFQALEHTRKVSHGMNPVIAEGDGLMHALRNHAETVTRTYRIRCVFRCTEPVLIPEPRVAFQLYRVAQEAIHNATRHGRAKCVTIFLSDDGAAIWLRIVDNGVGLPTDVALSKGMGLRTMGYRISLISGQFEIGRRKHGGTEVRCRVPKSSITA